MRGKIITFYLDGNLFGLEIAKVREVVRNVSYTPVPGIKSYIAGLMNMRGQVVTLFDISRIMGYEYGRNIQGTSCIILKASVHRPDYAGFLIEKPGEVLDIRDDWCQLPPGNIKGIERKFIKELVRLENELVILIEPAKIINECLTE